MDVVSTADRVFVAGQNWFAASLWKNPNKDDPDNKMALMIRGVFATESEAKAHSEKLQSCRCEHDVYVAPLYRWIGIPPDNSQVPEEHYEDPRLDALMRTEAAARARGQESVLRRRRQIRGEPQEGDEDEEEEQAWATTGLEE